MNLPSSHILEVIKLANQLESNVIIDFNLKNYHYEIRIQNVLYQEKKSYIRLGIKGTGFTIDDAAYDFLRKCRGDKLVHFHTDKEIEPL